MHDFIKEKKSIGLRENNNLARFKKIAPILFDIKYSHYKNTITCNCLNLFVIQNVI